MPDPEIVVRGRGDFRRLDSDLARAENRFGSLGSKIKAGLAGAAIAGSAALIKLGADAVGAASESQQSIGAAESVFGKYADLVIRRSKQAADAIGLSANEYRELSNVTGAMLASSGRPLREVADLTDRLNRRAADMAATFGGTTREAVEAIGSALRGETDPIERYGVAIKASDVSARLAAQGLDDLTGKSLKQAEQTARLELLFQQTSKVQGQFARESDTLAGAQQRLGAKVEDLEAKFGELLLPVLTDVTNWAGNRLVPALEDVQAWLSENRDEIADFGGAIRDTALPALRETVGVVSGAVNAFSDLPGPVRDLIVQAGIAAVVLPRLSGAVRGVTGGLAGMVTNLRNAETRTAALSSVARNAAGVAGLVALTQSAQTSDETLSGLAQTAGLAATGFAVGGPLGAAIGGTIGLFKEFLEIGNQATDFREEKVQLASYAASFDQLTGAINRSTRELILQNLQKEPGALKFLENLGLSSRTVVDAVLGVPNALRMVDQALAAGSVWLVSYTDAQGKSANAYLDTKAAAERWAATVRAEGGTVTELTNKVQNLGKWQGYANELLGRHTARLRGDQAAARDAIRATVDFGNALKDLPPRKRTQIEAQGVVPSTRGIARLAHQYDLLPKTVRSIIRETGADTTVKKVQRVREQLEQTDRTEVRLERWLRGLEGGLRRGDADAKRGARAIVKALEDLKADPNLSAYERRIIADLLSIKGKGQTQAQGIGNALESGLLAGLAGADSALSSRMRQIVANALAAARAEARSHSPSEETKEIGRDLGDGLVLGLREKQEDSKRGGRDLIRKLLEGVDEGSQGVTGALDKLTTLIRKRINLEDDKKERAREKRILENLERQYDALRKNGRAQDQLNKKLETAKQHLAEVRAYVDGIRQSFIETGNITQLGQLEDGSVSGALLLDQLRDQVNDAKRFADLIRDLTDSVGPKLNETSLQQLLTAGPEAALATVEALAAGGDAAIKELNSLTSQLATEGKSLGSEMSDVFFDVGLSAAEGIVKGLEKDAAALDRAARRLARRLAAEVRKALGIKSPSREFQRIGLDVLRGLDIGLDDTYVRQSGRRLATSLVKGFSTPQLAATVDAGSSTSPQVLSVRLTADQVSAMQRGKAIQVDIAAGNVAGARQLAIGGPP